MERGGYLSNWILINTRFLQGSFIPSIGKLALIISQTLFCTVGFDGF